jgi:hypothetical protein
MLSRAWLAQAEWALCAHAQRHVATQDGARNATDER